MAITVRITERIAIGADIVEHEQSFSETDEGYSSVAAVIAATTNDVNVLWSCDVSQLKAIYIVSDQDVTLETNSSSAPDDTINLKANIPYIWYTNKYDSCLLTVDVTTLYVSNAGATQANFKLKALVDSTPP